MTDESTNADPNRPVVAATASTLQEADVIRSVLQSADISAFILNENVTNMLPYMSIALNPSGVRITVRQCDLTAARKALDLPPLDGSQWRESAKPNPNSPDRFAEKAVYSAIFSILIPPLVILTLYYFFRALGRRRAVPPADPRAFRRNLVFVVISIGLTVLVIRLWMIHFWG